MLAFGDSPFFWWTPGEGGFPTSLSLGLFYLSFGLYDRALWDRGGWGSGFRDGASGPVLAASFRPFQHGFL
jgi:hypothetical protein